MRTAAVATLALVLLPPLAVSQSNPFKPGSSSRSEAAVFVPSAQPKPAVVIPPPLPAADGDEAVVTAPSVPQPPSRRSKSHPTACRIEITPKTPLVGAQGGEFTLRLKEGSGTRGCVAGIESHAPWLKIRFFNGHELALYAEPNEQARARHGELILANAANSVVVRVVQAAQ
jgi:hypothetical protein